VQQAERQLANADKTPRAALKDAVDVRTKKQKYKKLKNLAQVALVQQKAKAAKKISLAEENAKASVRLAVKDVEKKELKEAQGKLAKAQKQIAAQEEKKTLLTLKNIKQMTDAKVKAERYKFKKLVDAAVKLSPKTEESIRQKAKAALQKARIAAKAYATQIRKSARPRMVGGKRITKKMAAACIENPSGCEMFTLKNQNIGAAAKFAESQARKAKRTQLKAKEAVAKAMAKLNTATVVLHQMSQKAEDLDEKETRIRLAKLQLNEAKAAAAFHSAAKAHLQTQLAHGKMKATRDKQQDQLLKFQRALTDMKFTGNAKAKDLLHEATTSKKQAFEKAREAAKALLALKPK